MHRLYKFHGFGYYVYYELSCFGFYEPFIVMQMQEYMETLDQGTQFLHQHDQLLQSLHLSKQNASNQSYSENTQGIGNESVEPG